MPSATSMKPSSPACSIEDRRAVSGSHGDLSQRSLITAVFEASRLAVETLSHLVPDLDGNRAEYAVASVLLEEAWVSAR